MSSPSPEATRLQYFGPNWFASVMGTGIVATAAASLPVQLPGQRAFAEIVWVIASALLAVLVVAVSVQWFRHPTVARSQVRNPQMAHFYGAAPMALRVSRRARICCSLVTAASAGGRRDKMTLKRPPRNRPPLAARARNG